MSQFYTWKEIGITEYFFYYYDMYLCDVFTVCHMQKKVEKMEDVFEKYYGEEVKEAMKILGEK